MALHVAQQARNTRSLPKCIKSAPLLEGVKQQ